MERSVRCADCGKILKTNRPVGYEVLCNVCDKARWDKIKAPKLRAIKRLELTLLEKETQLELLTMSIEDFKSQLKRAKDVLEELK
jgi:phage FluMu protein Com